MKAKRKQTTSLHGMKGYEPVCGQYFSRPMNALSKKNGQTHHVRLRMGKFLHVLKKVAASIWCYSCGAQRHLFVAIQLKQRLQDGKGFVAGNTIVNAFTIPAGCHQFLLP